MPYQEKFLTPIVDEEDQKKWLLEAVSALEEDVSVESNISNGVISIIICGISIHVPIGQLNCNKLGIFAQGRNGQVYLCRQKLDNTNRKSASENEHFFDAYPDYDPVRSKCGTRIYHAILCLNQGADRAVQDARLLCDWWRRLKDPSIVEAQHKIAAEIKRMAQLIRQRVAASGQEVRTKRPERLADAEVEALLSEAWGDGRCALCNGNLALGGANPLLQPSPDRIDSQKPGYVAGNLQITHLACNLAKNDRSSAEFLEWLRIAADYGAAESP